MTKDLFGFEAPDLNAKITPEEVRKMKAAKRRAQSVPRGHYMPSGSGPAGETCGTCEHCIGIRCSKTYFKCKLAEKSWTASTRTDIRKKDAACSKWEKEKPS